MANATLFRIPERLANEASRQLAAHARTVPKPDWQRLTFLDADSQDAGAGRALDAGAGRACPPGSRASRRGGQVLTREALALVGEPVEDRRGRPERVAALFLELEQPVAKRLEPDRVG